MMDLDTAVCTVRANIGASRLRYWIGIEMEDGQRRGKVVLGQ